MIDTIYLDMDGVFCDFNERWHDAFGRTPKQSRECKEFSSDWTDFIVDGNFRDLPWAPGGEKLFEYMLAQVS